jgi:hypothetical protein
MKFTRTITVTNAAELESLMPSLQRGQWITLDGARGRVVGTGNTVWIAWGKAASNPWLFRKSVAGFKRTLTPLEIIRRNELQAYRAFA